MEVELYPNGQRARMYRPYINREEDMSRLTLYNPNGRDNSGLYTGAQPTCGSWLDMYQQYINQPRQTYSPNHTCCSGGSSRYLPLVSQAKPYVRRRGKCPSN